MSFGILDYKAVVPIRIFLERCGYRQAFLEQIVAELTGIFRLKADLDKLVVGFVSQRLGNLDVLMIVNLENNDTPRCCPGVCA